jgi:uncharacterized protein YdhG (YjbR/CyaY superfamily)
VTASGPTLPSRDWQNTSKDAMVKTDFKSVHRYIASRPEAAQAVLERVRSAIRKAVPDAEEVVYCEIPSYRLRGSTLIYFAGWKHHYSLYPATDHVVAALRTTLHHTKSTRTIRFPLSQPVPVKLIARIAKLRAQEFAEREKRRRPRPIIRTSSPLPDELLSFLHRFLRVPVIGVISKMAGCSSDTGSTASSVGCARTGNATESPMSAVRRVRLILMSGFPQRRESTRSTSVPKMIQ